MFLDWKIWRNRKDTETDTKKDTDRNTDEEIDTENNLRDIQTITAKQTYFLSNLLSNDFIVFPMRSDCAQSAVILVWGAALTLDPL